MSMPITALILAAVLSISARPLGKTLHGEAKTEYDRATKLFRTGDYANALRSYKKAHELQDDPRLLMNMAICEKQLRHYSKALPLAEAFVERARVSAKDLQDAKDFTRAIRELVGEVTLDCKPSDATITIDEAELAGVCEHPIVLDGGDHRLRATKQGFTEAVLTLSVPAGGARTITVALEPEPEPAPQPGLEPAPKQGRLSVNAGTGDSISIDGRALAQHSWSGVLPAGNHTVVVSAPGKRSQRSDVQVHDRDDQSVTLALEDEDEGFPVWAMIGGGAVVAAGLAVGGYFLFREQALSGTLGSHDLP